MCQGPNDLGFLLGLRDRLACGASVLDARDHPALRQRGVHLLRREANRIWEVCQRIGGDLIVRLTDAEDQSFQEIVREEKRRFPDAARELLICGACEPDIEHWLTVDLEWASNRLCFETRDLPSDRVARSGFIKQRIRVLSQPDDYATFVACFVREAPPEVMKRWLENPSFHQFYSECVRIAKRRDCRVNDERN